MRIKKGDQVKILTGKDRNKTGTVLKVLSEEERVIVDGLNLYKKRQKPKRQGAKGEIVFVPRPLSVSNLQLVCKSCKRPTRIGVRLEGDTRVRFCKKCQAAT